MERESTLQEWTLIQTLRFSMLAWMATARYSGSVDRVRGGRFDYPIPSPDGRYLAFTVVTYESNAWLLENF